MVPHAPNSRRLATRILATFALLIASAGFVTGQPGSALAAAAPATVAGPGTNLLLNADATAGDTSAQGWDAVTIPGWQITGGLPTVVRYGTPGFPETAASWPASRGNLFAGGAGGTATLVQETQVTPGARYDVAAWLGGTKTSAAELTVPFQDARGDVRATAVIGPVGKQASPVLAAARPPARCPPARRGHG